MKLIEHGEPINTICPWKSSTVFIGDNLTMEDTVQYITECQAVVNWEKQTIVYMIKVLGKKSDLICGDCGVNFISHKGMCSSCYVRQL